MLSKSFGTTTQLNLGVDGRNVSSMEGNLEISVGERHGYSCRDVVPLHEMQIAVSLLLACICWPWGPA